MKRPLIVLDIDEVLLDTISAINDQYNQQHGTNFSRRDFASYTWHHVWGISRDDAIDFNYDFFKDHADKIEPISGAEIGVRGLAMGHDLMALTARPEDHREVTQKSLDKHFPDIGKLRMVNSYARSGTPEFKSDYIRGKDAFLVIEDQVHHAIDMAPYVERVFLYNAPWNKPQNLPADLVLPNKVERVGNWDDILNKLF